MSILGRIAVKVKPAPVKTTRVLFDASRRTRSPNFGRGILRSLPSYRCEHSSQDEAWWAAESNRPERIQQMAIRLEMAEISAEADRMSEEDYWQECYENACLPL